MKDPIKLCEDEVLFQLTQQEDELVEAFVRAKNEAIGKAEREAELEQMWQTQRVESEPMDATTRAMLVNGQFGKHGTPPDHKIAIAAFDGCAQSCADAFKELADAMSNCGRDVKQFAYVVTDEAKDILVSEGFPEENFIVSNSFPDLSELLPSGGDVVIMGGRGGGKSTLAADLIENIANQHIKPQRRGCHKNAELDGRTSKGDRRRKRQQWNRPRGAN